MCCFSQSVEFVTNTSIFARPDGDHQLLAYAMRVGASEDLSMVLPLPVPPGSPEDAVAFIDLSAYPTFFEHLEGAFPTIEVPQSRSGRQQTGSFSIKLEVHQVGEFEASFVPSISDFDRLDSRFRLPAQVWDRLPEYSDWGFAVFKLRSPTSDAPRRGQSSGRDFHPMAFRFRRRDTNAVFFPTVHIHDGEVHPTARFDHRLYLQSESVHIDNTWMKSAGPLKDHLRMQDVGGLVAGESIAFRKLLIGELVNQDLYVP